MSAARACCSTRAVIVWLAALLTACAPRVGVPPGSSPEVGPGAADTAAAPSRLTVAIGGDATNLATKLTIARGVFASDFSFMVNSPLVVLDPEGAARAFLASELPSRDRGSWTINPDGTMATTWRIRPNALWHDGQPVVSADFAFALKVYLDDVIAVRNREPERLIDRIEPQDSRTFVLHWKQPYPFAHRLLQGELEPLPAHLLATLYQQDKEAFQNASFWTSTAYVGNGPFQLADWDKGVQLVYRAFHGYFMGPPKIDEVIFRIITDMSTVVANVLSGAVDATVAVALNHPGAATVKERWEQSGEGQVATTPAYFRHIQIQHDPARTRQSALLDFRVRRALVHGMDRVAIADVVTVGASPLADTMIPPRHPLFPQVSQAIATYPFDRSRALALLQEADWTRRGDTLVNASGEPFVTEIWTTHIADNETEMRLVASGLRTLGIQVTENSIPIARNQDREYRANFPGLSITAASVNLPKVLQNFSARQCPRAEGRFAGSNNGCWSQPEFERLLAIALGTLDEQERGTAIVGALKELTYDVGVIGMSFNMETIAIRKGLIGLGPRWPGQGGTTWNVHEWRWS